MLKDNEKNFSRLHMIIDAIVLVLSYFLAWLIRFVGPDGSNSSQNQKLSAVYADAGFYCTGLSVVVSGFHIVYSHADAGASACIG